MSKEYWLSDSKSGIKEAVLSKIYNNVEERANRDFSLTKMEEELTKGFIGCFCT